MALFVSYTRSDKAPVRVLRDDLEQMGHSVWLDHQIHGGERWWQEIIQRIQDAEVFLFALSKDSLRSAPCRAELSYAEQLRVPVIPVQVGQVENLKIPLAQKQIVDYRERGADAVIALIAAVTELSTRPRQLPDPLPEPPEIPFEYLYRIAGRIDVQQISPDDQDQLIAELRRWLKTEEDDVARRDILNLLHDLRTRNELTVPHAAEIDEILSGLQARRVPSADSGVTRLPPAEHWRRRKPRPKPGAEQSSTSAPTSPPSSGPESGVPGPGVPGPGVPGSGVGASWWRTAGAGEGTAPPKAEGTRKERSMEGGETPAWLTDLIARAPSAETGAGATVAGTAPDTSGQVRDTPPRARKWWTEEQSASQSPAAPESSAQPAPHPSRYRFAFVILVVVLVLVVLLIVASNL